MADIELVIKIPEKVYNANRLGEISPWVTDTILDAVQSGTPLPKGHGKLKDADKFNYNSDNYITKHGVESAPTIIEADKESKP